MSAYLAAAGRCGNRLAGLLLGRSPWLPGLGAAGSCAPASSSAARAARKKKQKLRFRYVKTPSHQLRQKEGDFPVQVRPAQPPALRDLQDAALDAEAGLDRAPKVKPHKVREALQQQLPPKLRGTVDDMATLPSDLRSRQVDAARVPHFNPERDLSEQDAAELTAMKARAQAKRNYKWMPNPFGPKPGPLGTSPQAEAKYYARYFDGQQAKDGVPAGAVAGEEFREAGSPAPRRERISPKRFWIQPEHVTPAAPAVALMTSRELKYSMVNEAHLVRKWRNSRPEGRAAGMPPGSGDLWMAFGYRAAELASGKPGAGRPALDSEAGGDAEAAASRVGHQRCSLSTTLRFLQALASVQAGPYSAMQLLVGRVLEHLQDLRPHQCFFLLNAMSRLRLRAPKASNVLQRMGLVWLTLPTKKLVRTANAVAKLDLGNHLWARPLKAALVRLLPRLSGRQLANLKAIAVMELLDSPESMRVYLEQCERTRSEHWYPRHLQMLELHVHLLYPDLWGQLDERVRLFLQEVRTAAEASRGASGPGPGSRRAGAAGSDGGSGSDSEDEASDSEGERARPGQPWSRGGFDRHSFSSELHQDLSRVLKGLGVEHHNLLAAGPMTVDVCHTPTMTVVEAGARWQFYLRSPRLTALARRRHELLRAMGFRVVHVSYHRWEALRDDEAKAAFLRGCLPAEVLPRLQPGPHAGDAGQQAQL